MAMPIIRILTGAQPLATAGADQFLAHFAPYFGWSLLTVALVGGGQYTFSAFALQTASFWIHVQATILTAARPAREVRRHAEDRVARAADPPGLAGAAS